MISRHEYLSLVLIENRRFDRKQEIKKNAIDNTQGRKIFVTSQLVQLKGIPEYTLKIKSPQKLFLKSHSIASTASNINKARNLLNKESNFKHILSCEGQKTTIAEGKKKINEKAQTQQ